MSLQPDNLLSILLDLNNQASYPEYVQLMQITVSEKCEINLFIQGNELKIEIYIHGKSPLYLSRLITDDKTYTFEDLLLYILDESSRIINEDSDLDLPYGHRIYYKQDDIVELNISNRDFMKLPLRELPLSSGILLYKENHKCEWCSTISKNIRHKCSACKKVYYCDESCQKFDWKIHKHECIENID